MKRTLIVTAFLTMGLLVASSYAAAQDVTLPPDGEPSAIRVRFTLAEPGPRVLSFRVGAQDGEQVTQYNVRQALVTVKDRRERVLYVEGAPRFEMKFLRRAAAGDPNLQVVMLQMEAFHGN